MFILLQVTLPSYIEVDTWVIAKLSLSFILLAGVCWGVRHLIRVLSRS